MDTARHMDVFPQRPERPLWQGLMFFFKSELLEHMLLGKISADEVLGTALLQLAHMGAKTL
ncbi:hypothetical protein F8C76_01535 [Flagellimonas olearia]|uniref:Uncharacterized protein n=1 Tax=Flagellimonas olearia TaxID=552546 RepID=A0A6I1DY54_9FLAO|nr:hypothetical protein [Allomuricauda olearia]KAB7530218.1 hypothetical protein F8C76_01535 [Allomuricauda olearia]